MRTKLNIYNFIANNVRIPLRIIKILARNIYFSFERISDRRQVNKSTYTNKKNDYLLPVFKSLYIKKDHDIMPMEYEQIY